MLAVTTCVNYDDYLNITLPNNKQYFDSVVVITSKEDLATQQLAKEQGVELLVTDSFYTHGDIFNKGRAINEVLKALKNKWVCHLDADIWYSNPPPKGSELTKGPIYGCSRLMCPNKEAWKDYLSGGSTKRWQKLSPSHFRLDNQVINKYLPLGYTQIFFNESGINYPENSSDASESDLRFALSFETQLCLPYSVIHLPAGGGYSEGANWQGRITPRFD